MIIIPIEMPHTCLECPFKEIEEAPCGNHEFGFYEKYIRCRWQNVIYDIEKDKQHEDDNWESKFDPTLSFKEAKAKRMEYCPLKEIEGGYK